MKTYSRTVVALLILTALLLAMPVFAQEQAPVTPIKRTSSVVLDTQARVKVTPTPSPTPKLKIKVPREIPKGIFIPKNPEEPQRTNPTTPKMPRVIGQPIQDAERVVRQRQPNAQISSIESPRPNPDYRAGAVISQFPKEDSDLKPGDGVRLLYNPQQVPRGIKMPNFTGFDYATAERQLIGLALNIQVRRGVGRSHNPNYRVDIVVNQMPPAGEVLAAGAQVILYLNPPLPKMPNLIGQETATARTRMQQIAPNSQPQFRQATVHSPNYSVGVVISQSPDAGTDLARNTEIVLYINPAPAVLRMPNLVGFDAETAGTRLRRVLPNPRLRTEQASTHVPSYPVNVVVSQSPTVRTELKPETEIVLYLNPPPFPKMPNLIGMDYSSATARLRQEALNIQSRREMLPLYNSVYEIGAVAKQSPDAGTDLKPGTIVVLSINPAPKMPDLTGLTASVAEERLRRVAPKVQVRRETARSFDPRYSVGAVADQSPSAGTELNTGSSAVLYLNPQPPKMPNLIGMDPGAAGNRLRLDAPNIQWRMEQAGSNNSGYAAGLVVAQSVAAGTELRPGAMVVLSINPQLSTHSDKVRVPEIRGLTFNQARDVLASLQLKIASASAQSGDVATFNVTGQQPVPGEFLPVGGTVSVTIVPPQIPLPPDEVVVPDLVKKELPEAIGLLRAVGLDVGEVKDKDQKEKGSFVVEQQPAAGQRVKVGTRINVVTGKKSDGGILAEWPKVLAVAAFGFAAFLLARLWKRLRPKPSPPIPLPDPEPLLPPPTLGFRATLNANSAEFATSTELNTSFALRFQPRADLGQQYVTVYGALIAAESEEL